jgi:hypothetical protein
VLTDKGIQFTFQPRFADGPTARYMTHLFDIRCQRSRIKRRPTKIRHPSTNRQVGKMNRTIKEATVKCYHYDNHQQLNAHLADFIHVCNLNHRLKALKGLTPARIHPQKLDKRTETIQASSDPSKAGTRRFIFWTVKLHDAAGTFGEIQKTNDQIRRSCLARRGFDGRFFRERMGIA